SDDSAQTNEALEQLFDLAFQPLAPYVRTGDVAIVADGSLMRAPFAALRDRKTGEYLIERHAVRFLPSIHFAMNRALRNQRTESVELLAAGDPILDAAEYRTACESDEIERPRAVLTSNTSRSRVDSPLPGAQVELASLRTLASQTPGVRVEVLQGC